MWVGHGYMHLYVRDPLDEFSEVTLQVSYLSRTISSLLLSLPDFRLGRN